MVIDSVLSCTSAFISAAFSYTGTESVILAAGEATNPTKQIPKAAKRVMWRIIVFCKLLAPPPPLFEEGFEEGNLAKIGNPPILDVLGVLIIGMM